MITDNLQKARRPSQLQALARPSAKEPLLLYAINEQLLGDILARTDANVLSLQPQNICAQRVLRQLLLESALTSGNSKKE